MDLIQKIEKFLYEKNVASRSIACVLYFFYTGGTLLVLFTDWKEDFVRWKHDTFAMLIFSLVGLAGTLFARYVWKNFRG